MVFNDSSSRFITRNTSLSRVMSLGIATQTGDIVFFENYIYSPSCYIFKKFDFFHNLPAFFNPFICVRETRTPYVLNYLSIFVIRNCDCSLSKATTMNSIYTNFSISLLGNMDEEVTFGCLTGLTIKQAR